METNTKSISRPQHKSVSEFKLEQRFKATIVWLILNGKVEKALEILAKKHGVRVPIIEVGLPKRNKRKALDVTMGRRGRSPF